VDVRPGKAVMTMTPGEPALFHGEAEMSREEATKVSDNGAKAREIDEVRRSGEAADATENTDGFPVIAADGKAS
jgi:hypothetical protein